MHFFLLFLMFFSTLICHPCRRNTISNNKTRKQSLLCGVIPFLLLESKNCEITDKYHKAQHFSFFFVKSRLISFFSFYLFKLHVSCFMNHLFWIYQSNKCVLFCSEDARRDIQTNFCLNRYFIHSQTNNPLIRMNTEYYTFLQ